MRPIRVLIVDDAVVMRRLVSDALANDPAIEVVGTAANGRLALAKIPQLDPDVVILDIEMPELDGLGTLKEIRLTCKGLPVIMFSSLTGRGAEATLDALALGASDCLAKPSNSKSYDESMSQLRDELLPKVKYFGSYHQGLQLLPRMPFISAKRPPAARSHPRRVEVIAMCASSGGPDALARILGVLAKSPPLPVPLVLVQHMPPSFTRYLGSWLGSRSGYDVREPAQGQALTAGTAWLAPGDAHLAVAGNGRGDGEARFELVHSEPENGCRPSADVLFRSLAKRYGEGTLAMVLTGMGQDGLRGAEAVRAAGGQVIVQDEASSVLWGVGGSVCGAGLADCVVSLDALPEEMLSRVSFGRSAGAVRSSG